MRKQIFLILLILSSQLVFCEQISVLKDKQTVNSESSNASELTEKQAYKMLYDNQVKANDSVLKTIFYALGGLGSAMLLVFASNWWFNDKKVKDIIKEIDTKINTTKNEMFSELSEKNNTFSTEVNALVNQIQSKLQVEINTQNNALATKLIEFNEKINVFITESTASLNQMQTNLHNEINLQNNGITTKFMTFTDEIRSEIKEDNKGLLLNYQKQLETFSLNFTQQITTINNSINSISTNLKDVIDSKNDNLRSLIESEKQSIQSDLNNVKSKIFRNEYYMWDARGVHFNALSAQLKELEVLANNKFTNLEFYIKQLLSTLDKVPYMYKSDLQIIERIKTLTVGANSDLMQTVVDKVKTMKVNGES